MKKTKFTALRNGILLPDNCHYLDLGEQADFVGDVEEFYRGLSSGFVLINRKKPSFPAGIEAAAGYSHSLIILLDDDSVEKYSLVMYLPRELRESEAGYWHTRGHEEGHALFHFDLEHEVKKILGRGIDISDEESVCDLLGSYAYGIRCKKEAGARK
jgi:hypothetical protein